MRKSRVLGIGIGAAGLVGLVAMPAGAMGAGAGAFAGTISFVAPPPLTGCGPVRASLSFTTVVALTNGSIQYTGPLTITGSGAGNWCGDIPDGSMYPTGSAVGTNAAGSTVSCPVLNGMMVEAFVWSWGMTPPNERPCTLDGMPLDRFSLWLEGASANAVVGLDGVHTAVVSGAVAVSVW